MIEQIEEIVCLSEQTKASPLQTLAKLMEEVGELSIPISIHSGAHGFEKKANDIGDVEYNIAEECCDVIMNALTILVQCTDYSIEDLKTVMDEKIEKWRKKVEREND